MQCTSISITKKGAVIGYLEEANGGVKRTVYKSKEAPLPDLPAALKAFIPYVINLCGLPKKWADDMVITTLSIKEPNEDGLRGLSVHWYRGIEKANGRPMQAGAPFMPEAGENTSENIFTLDDETLALIATAEAAAERYVDGEHGEQIDAFDDDEDVEEVDEAVAAD